VHHSDAVIQVHPWFYYICTFVMTNSLHVNRFEGTHPWISLGFPVVLPHAESDQAAGKSHPWI